MSVLNKKPFIQLLLDTLSSEEKSALLNCINGATSVRKYSLVQRDLSVSTPIESIQLETKTKIYNGYKIYKSDKITFLMYNIGQEINIYQVDYPYYEKELKGRIRESLSIEELRRYLESGEGGVGETVTVGEIDSEEAEAGKVIVSNGEGGAVWGDASAGLPEAEAEGRVLVGKSDGDWEQKKAAPLADNLLANPINNDAMYSSGPTGGLADITTGEEAYLQEIKGMSIVWNQLYNGSQFSTNSSHIYIRYRKSDKTFSLLNQITDSIPSGNTDDNKIYDLTLMFGGNDKIPFSLVQSDEYPANGTMPAQSVNAQMRFQRLFANVDLTSAPYDAGTIKNVKATKLVETSRNLWDTSTMETTGLKLLAGYRYEIYIDGFNYRTIALSYDGVNWTISTSLTRFQRADGKYIWTYLSSTSVYIKSYSDTNKICYVGFVHSGNYCLTSGTNTSGSAAKTSETIPAYHKHEFSIDGIDGLNGLLDSTGKVSVYDTKDYTRVGSVELSSLTWEPVFDGTATYKALIPNIKPSTSLFLCSNSTFTRVAIDENGYLKITAVSEPTSGTFLYELNEPVATGEPAFEPIALKSGDTWIVDDMGSEYFIQPSGANCPVNQVSYYYENLKDKLQNLELPKIEATEFDNSATIIDGLNINGNKYKLVPTGSTSYSPNALPVGRGAHANSMYAVCVTPFEGYANGSNSTVVGPSGGAYEYGSISIGGGYAGKTESIAIGLATQNYIPYSVTFDTNTNNTQRTIHTNNPDKVFFRYENCSTSKYTFASYTSGHYLSEYIQNQILVLQDGKYYISYTDANNFKTFSNNRISGTDADITSTVKGVHLIVKLSNNVVASLDLLPYDSANSQAFTAYGIASDTPSFVSAYIDSDGCVVLTLPSGITATEVKYNLK